MLRISGSSSPQVRRTADIIVRQVRHMTRLVDDLLDVSRVTRGLVQLERAPLDVAAAVAAAVDQVRPLAQERRHELAVHAEGPAWVEGDFARVVQVAGNILHNACKDTPGRGGTSASRCAPTAARCCWR